MAWLPREPGIAPLHRLPRLQDANLQNAGAHPVFQPPPHDRAVVARDDDVEHDGAAQEVRFDGPVGGVTELERDGRASTDARPWRNGKRELERVQNVVSGPSSCSMFAMGLYTNSVPAPFPPQRMPSRFTPEPVSKNTSEPESPAPTPAVTRF